MRTTKSRTLLPLTAVAATLGLLLSGCGGEASSTGVEGGNGEGFEFGATQEEVDAVLADVEPITLTYQAGASSPNSASAANGLAFAEYVEERSGGKINLETVWGQAIATYSELEDALVDGRVDIAYFAAIYFPDEFPTVDAFSQVSQYSTPAPMTGEMITAAMLSDLAWNDDEHLGTMEDKGLVPLSPLMNSGDYWTACTEPGSSPEDWRGRQIRIGGSAQSTIAEEIGASPVSIEHAEAFEALQRGTVDCTFVQPQVAGASGILEVAPYVSHFSDQRMTGSASAMHVAGSAFEQLPLAYQQIIFDAEVAHLGGTMESVMNAGQQAVIDGTDAGGEFVPIDAATEETMTEAQEGLVDELISSGRLPEDIRGQMEGLAEKWTGIVEELGYTDDGELGELDEWYEPGGVDFEPLAERVFVETAEQHRPN